jgi:hypothetical protein
VSISKLIKSSLLAAGVLTTTLAASAFSSTNFCTVPSPGVDRYAARIVQDAMPWLEI